MHTLAKHRSSLHVRGSLLWLSLGLALCSACKKGDDAPPADTAEALGSAAPGEHEHGKRELPPAAFDACQGKAAGDACTVQFGTRQVDATCAAAPDGRLACKPQHGGHKKPDGS
jgi:hypothetical protein